MSGNIPKLSLYDAEQFKRYGEQILQECKTLVDKIGKQNSPQIVPMVRKKDDEDNSSTSSTSGASRSASSALGQLEFNKIKSGSSITNSSNIASGVYDGVKGRRAGATRESSDLLEDQDGVDDTVSYLSENEDNSTNEKMMNLYSNYQKQYGDKYITGNITSDNEYQYEFTTDISGFSTSGDSNIVIGSKKSATSVNASFEYSVISGGNTDENVDSDKDVTESENSNNSLNSRRSFITRSDENPDDTLPDPNIPEQPPERKQITNNKSMDVSILHNRAINMGRRECSLGVGAEYHSHEDGNSTQLTFRGGIVDIASGFGVTVTTTKYGSIDEYGERHTLRDTKVKAIILNNETDEYPMEEAQEDESEDISQLPIVQTKNKLGFNLITEDQKLGGDVSYVIRDVSSLKNDKYQRSQIYLKGGYLNEPQGADTPDSHKIKLGAVCRYQNINGNGDYLNAELSAMYHNTVQSGSTPSYLVGIGANVDAKIGANQISFEGSGVKADTNKFLTATVGYKYITKKWDINTKFGYCNMNMAGAPLSYIAISLSAAYKINN